MRWVDEARRRVGLGAIAALATVVVCLIVLQPFRAATVDTDSATSVLYFRYIVSGHHLEAFVPTLPKPLLTVLYGVTWDLTHDWRVPVLETIGAFSVAVASAARLADRLAGPFGAGFAVVALLAWPDMLIQVAHANSLPWAVAGWLMAGVALTGDRRRPGLAGVALFIAGLARLETVWLVAAGVVAMGFIALRSRRTRRWDLVRAAAVPVGLGALAVPALCLHDWLLTGMPLYWSAVQAGYTAIVDPGLHAVGFTDFWWQVIWPRYSAQILLLSLAFAGLVKLALDGRWLILAALVALPTGVGATLALLARRGIFITDRYWAEADVALVFGSAIGAAFLADIALHRLRARGRAIDAIRPLRSALLIGSGGMVALALAWSALSSTDVQADLAVTRSASADLESVSARLTPILRGATGGVTSVPGVELPLVNPGSVRLFAPRPDVPRVAVETGAPYSAIGDNYLAFRGAPPGDVLRPGQWVLHIASSDTGYVDLSSLELGGPGTVGQMVLVPVIADDPSGVWLLRVDALPR